MKILNGSLGDVLGYLTSEYKTNKSIKDDYVIKLHSNQLEKDLEILAQEVTVNLGFNCCHHGDGVTVSIWVSNRPITS